MFMERTNKRKIWANRWVCRSWAMYSRAKKKTFAEMNRTQRENRRPVLSRKIEKVAEVLFTDNSFHSMIVVDLLRRKFRVQGAMKRVLRLRVMAKLVSCGIIEGEFRPDGQCSFMNYLYIICDKWMGGAYSFPMPQTGVLD